MVPVPVHFYIMNVVPGFSFSEAEPLVLASKVAALAISRNSSAADQKFAKFNGKLNFSKNCELFLSNNMYIFYEITNKNTFYLDLLKFKHFNCLFF